MNENHTKLEQRVVGQWFPKADESKPGIMHLGSRSQRNQLYQILSNTYIKHYTLHHLALPAEYRQPIREFPFNGTIMYCSDDAYDSHEARITEEIKELVRTGTIKAVVISEDRLRHEVRPRGERRIVVQDLRNINPDLPIFHTYGNGWPWGVRDICKDLVDVLGVDLRTQRHYDCYNWDVDSK